MTRFKVLAAALLCSVCVGVIAEELLLDELWEENDALPQVLTATRLKQPRAETPAAVTVIEAEQIAAWGARSIPEVLRFVPGMFVGHSQKENTATVVYHASTQNVMRRLQVLVDGRSVYKAAIARVIWDDIPVAVEDIQRIEVIRGPNSAVYGANAFMATINIITKDPADTLGTRLRYRGGNQQVDDRFVSHSAEIGNGSYRISGSYQSDDGLDGPHARHGKDKWNDDSRHQFVNITLQQQLSSQVQMRFDAGFDDTYADITNSRSSYETQYRDSQSANAQLRFDFDFSPTHQSQLQMYWQREQREHKSFSRVMAITLDPRLRTLFERYPEDVLQIANWAQSSDEFEKNKNKIIGIVSGFTSEEQGWFFDLEGYVEEKTYGTFDYGYNERRGHIEWQDVVVWSPTLRTVSGVSARQDHAYSRTFFGGSRHNNTYQVFANAEWRIVDPVLFNLGGMYEKDDFNGEAFAPRAAFNFMLNPRQSVRLVYSEAVRSPDMLEQRPDMRVRLTDLSNNYLGYSEGIFFMNRASEDSNLKHEKIRSYELGYFGTLANNTLELDVKLYRDELTRLISGDPSNVDETNVSNDSSMTITGAETQLNWNMGTKDWLWLTLAYMDIDKDIRTSRNYCVETCLSPRKSGTLSWHHRFQSWSSTLSYFWLNGFADNQSLYHRGEWHVRKEWSLGRYTPWVGGFLQHQFAHTTLGYDTQRYSTRNIYYLQAGLNF